MICDECGKHVSGRFPMHECTPPGPTEVECPEHGQRYILTEYVDDPFGGARVRPYCAFCGNRQLQRRRRTA